MEDKFAIRLRSERKRLGYTQEEFAALCGVATITQGYYESGKRKPDANYLLAASNAGADIFYILKGKMILHSETLQPRETALLNNYRHTPEEGKRFIEQTAMREAERQAQTIPRKIAKKS